MPFIEQGKRLFVERGRLFVKQRRRDRSSREGGGHPLWEGGGCSSREEAVHQCGGKEEQWISTLGNSKFNMII